MAVFVMQSLGCEVAALNTVQFSNHKAYKQVKGTIASGEEIRDIYEGLKQSYLTDFDIMLSGYAPSAEAVGAIGSIGRDLKLKGINKSGSFFWVLDPVMGDQGRLYVNEDVVPAYKNLLHDTDLILPNQFEAELLSEQKIICLDSLAEAITVLHKRYRIPHIVVTSVRLEESSRTISVVGSTIRTDSTPRLFKIDVPAIDCFFSGTGDMFAALTVVRLREAVAAAKLGSTRSWISPDDVEATDLPLARATEKVLASIQVVLEKTKTARDEALERMSGPLGTLERERDSEKRLHLRKTKAAEVRVVRNVADLKEPKVVFRAEAFDGKESDDARPNAEDIGRDDGCSEKEGVNDDHKGENCRPRTYACP
ncbi:MAG: pyridoxine kinase [Lasallia pustulata]|uniref:pyridoxal kinase n=1 Tax=Lasallia pustulata TaxID=136370 RepID=A0A5M8Q127_9LECA|nr:MAG: pyridoxine kinase [Lasallia pustulata]